MIYFYDQQVTSLVFSCNLSHVRLPELILSGAAIDKIFNIKNIYVPLGAQYFVLKKEAEINFQKVLRFS